MNDEGTAAIVIIALLGNPFSPAYARARRAGGGRALDYCSMNVAVYARHASAWSLTERRIETAHRSAGSLSIGESRMRWEGRRLVLDLDERTAPLGRRIQGRVILEPESQPACELAIDAAGEHRWWPIAPLARIDVNLRHPDLRFTGHGYHDANAGRTSLDAAFETWSWSRARTREGAIITYDATGADGLVRSHALGVAADGKVDVLSGLSPSRIDTTRWRIAREVRGDEGSRPRVLRSLEDGPFYARALVETRLAGQTVVAMHETLAAYRLRARWVNRLTRFRMRIAP